MTSHFQKLITGAVAGLLATLPMTIFMQAAWYQLPARELHPLPPRQITRIFLRRFGGHRRIRPQSQTALTLLLHFLYGSAAGSIYGVMDKKFPVDNPVSGSLAGIVLWTGSYLGWLPALRILPPATRHFWRMNVLMIIAHLIWGMSFGLLTQTFRSRRRYIHR